MVRFESLTLFESLYMNIVLSAGWISGGFPISSPFQRKKFVFKILGLSTIWSFGNLCLSIIMGIMYLLYSLEFVSTMKASEAITLVCYSAGTVGSDIIRRGIGIWYCPKMIEIVSWSASFSNSSGHSRYIILAFFAALGMTGVKISNIIYIFFAQPGVFVPETFNIYSVFMPIYHTCSIALVEYFSFSFTIICGINLTRTLQFHTTKLTEWMKLHRLLGSKQGYTKELMSLEQLMNMEITSFQNEFCKIKALFAYFNLISGCYVFCFALQLTSGFLNNIYDIQLKNPLNGPVSDVLGIMQSVFVMILFGNLGTLIKYKIAKLKDDINIEIKEWEMSSCQRTVNIRKLMVSARAIQDWKWKFTAIDLFDINRNMLPSICGTWLTLIIFIFQLKMSEGLEETKFR